jgi:hypothetical protein
VYPQKLTISLKELLFLWILGKPYILGVGTSVVFNFFILKADKGNKTVVMDWTEYDDKILNMLNDQQTYKKLRKDPRNVCEKQMKKLLSSKAKRLDDKLLKKLKTTDRPTPRIYCTACLRSIRIITL